jgi:hypothetical protein
MTLSAVIVFSACASDTKTAVTTSQVATTSTTASTVVSTTNVSSGSPTTSSAGSSAGQSFLGVRMCLSALVDDSNAPGANFVEKVTKLSVGYPLVEPLAAAEKLCNEASAQLEAESAEPGSPTANLLAATDDINTALDLATHQIRTDAFYFKSSLPTQFIPDGATALRESIQVFYSRASVLLG